MAERVFYRNDEEFKVALDKAVETINERRRAGRFAGYAWVGLWVLLALTYLSQFTFRWSLRGVVPGLDLTSVLWVLIIGIGVLFHVRSRHQHTRILRSRQCLACGERLLRVGTDEDGNGTCPSCGRVFNLGEYRRPNEQRGAQFQGYLDADHFDKAMYAAGERVKKRSGLGLEGDLIGWMWIALGVTFAVEVFLEWSVFGFLPGSEMWFWAWLPGMFVWSGLWTWRVRRMVPSIVANRRCLECGYSLLGTPPDAAGLGRCPECATVFALVEYERPAETEAKTEGESTSNGT